ncbi:hypothetical protein CFC21_110556 [Triticum aestivum]|uniref:Uncharacterized protein n=2 Tax=Triticum aestivum TaxID=4565 RepID=A0A3B6TW42_WHEAT|nr:uncharacterized protein LOC123168151 [Triticum aestivum]KAF7110451.1 hypothetical protein CFC21_110556 [Triticum aestivum]
MLETILIAVKAIETAVVFVARSGRTASEIKIKCQNLSDRVKTLETILSHYRRANRDGPAMATALDSLGVALSDALRLVESHKSAAVGDLFPKFRKRDLDELVHADQKIESCIRDLELAREADGHLARAVAPAPQRITINNCINVMVLVQFNRLGGGAPSSSAPSSLPSLPPLRKAAVVPPAEARRTHREQKNHPVQPTTETTRETHREHKNHPVRPPTETTKETHREHRNHPVRPPTETRETYREHKNHPVRPPMETTRQTHREHRNHPVRASRDLPDSSPQRQHRPLREMVDGGTSHHNNPGSTQATVARVPRAQYRGVPARAVDRPPPRESPPR